MNERRRLESILGCGPCDRLAEGAVARWRGKEYIIGTADEAALLGALTRACEAPPLNTTAAEFSIGRAQ